MEQPLDLLRKALVGRYGVEAELGRGGMATVYLAEDRKHRRKVAIKVLRPDLAAALGAERFLREIEVTAKLAHPHILALYDSGRAGAPHGGGEFLYYVMPYVEGESLRERLRREQQLPIEEALQIAREVGDALGYAHSYGVVHRDIKPENILLHAGHAVVADFGIARAITAAGGEQLTATGMAVGTPAYMSPEQSSGADRVDGRSDIYALGCVLYEMLAGEPPYTGPSPQAVFAKRLSEPVPHVSTLRETIPVHIEQAITKALAKTPADRFTTTAAFLAALTSAVPQENDRTLVVRRRMPRRGVVAALVGAVAVVALTMAVLPGLMGPAGASLRHLAVLPCANRMGDPEQDYIPAGVHEELVTSLGRIAAVEVRGRSSVLRYEGTALSSPEIAGELGVGGLVECSVYRVGTDSVRVTASLRDGPQDRQLWSDAYQRARADMFQLGSDVARAVADALQAVVTPTEQARIAAQPTRNRDALTHYHRGRYLMTRWTEEGIRSGIDYFERAIALDSTFALAYAGLAEATIMLGDLAGVPGDVRPVDIMPRARELVLKALTLDPQLADAHYLLGFIRWSYDYDYIAGERESRRATELDPTNAVAWQYYGLALAMMGRSEEAIAAGRRAIELDPVAPLILSDMGAILLLARRYDEAMAMSTASMELDPDLPNPHSIAGDVAILTGDPARAITAHERAWTLSDHPVYLAGLASAHVHAGDTNAALDILDDLLRMREQRYVSPRAFALTYTELDSLNQAMEWFMRAAETRDSWIQFDIWSPLTADKLRGHPRYPDLLRLLRLDG